MELRKSERTSTDRIRARPSWAERIKTAETEPQMQRNRRGQRTGNLQTKRRRHLQERTGRGRNTEQDGNNRVVEKRTNRWRQRDRQVGRKVGELLCMRWVCVRVCVELINHELFSSTEELIIACQELQQSHLPMGNCKVAALHRNYMISVCFSLSPRLCVCVCRCRCVCASALGLCLSFQRFVWNEIWQPLRGARDS